MDTQPENSGNFSSPLEKLAASRRALDQALHPVPEKTSARRASSKKEDSRASARNTRSLLPTSKKPAQKSRFFASEETSAKDHLLQLGNIVGAVARRRWRSHPVHLVADVGRPFLMHQARKRPARLLAIAAVAGAAVVLLKPWKWKAPQRYLRSSAGYELSRVGSAGLGYVLSQFLGKMI
ncbi:MAG: hypothetical protein Q4G39_08230 [Brachymonas sp.]|nr:hypothetical protein [Brachymonas sp.]